MNKLFLLLLAGVVLLANGCSDNKAAEKKQETALTGSRLQTALVEQRSVEQTVKLPAQLAAYQEVSIFPKVNGYVTSVSVDIGSHVREGQLLMTLEAPELVQATVQAKERYARSQADYTISRENYERLKEASHTPGAISPMDLATAKAKTEADSALSNSEKANWQMQQTMMAYLKVTAPFTGVITARNVHPGALVSETNKNIPLLELKEVDHLRLQVDIPESFASTLRSNDTLSFYLSAYPGKKLMGRISRKSMNMNIQYRSERVEADVYNKEEILTPGMYADVLFGSKGKTGGISVPLSAVVTSTERKYVIVLRNGKTVRVDITTGNESHNRVEIVGAVSAGEKVIAPANDEIPEGVDTLEFLSRDKG